MANEVRKTSYIDADGNKQIGYIVGGSTFTDEAGKNPVGAGSIVDAGGQQWVKGADGKGVSYADYLGQNGLTETSYLDPTGTEKKGYIKNGVTYADILAQNPVGTGSVVNVNGQQIYKGESGNMLYSDFLKQQTPKATTYVDSAGNVRTGYIINGRTFTDKAGTTPVGEGSIVQAGGQQWVKGADGKGVSYADYLDEPVAESDALKQALAEAENAYNIAMAANNTVYAAQLKRNMEDIARQIENLNAGYKNVNTQLYRDYMEDRRNMPQLLAAHGISGGMSESTLLGLETSYQNALAENERERLSGIKDIELSGSDAELELAIAKAEADAAAGDTAAARRLEILYAMQDQRNYETERRDEKMAANSNKLYSAILADAEASALGGDFSKYLALGYSPEAVAAMEAAWKAEQEKAAYEAALEEAILKDEYGDSSAIYDLLGIQRPSYAGVIIPPTEPEVTYGSGFSTEQNVNGVKPSEWGAVKNNIAINLRAGNDKAVESYMDQVADQLSEEQWTEIKRMLDAAGFGQ